MTKLFGKVPQNYSYFALFNEIQICWEYFSKIHQMALAMVWNASNKKTNTTLTSKTFQDCQLCFYEIFPLFSQNSPFWGFSAFLGWFESQITAENWAQWLNKWTDYIATELNLGKLWKIDKKSAWQSRDTIFIFGNCMYMQGVYRKSLSN